MQGGAAPEPQELIDVDELAAVAIGDREEPSRLRHQQQTDGTAAAVRGCGATVGPRCGAVTPWPLTCPRGEDARPVLMNGEMQLAAGNKPVTIVGGRRPIACSSRALRLTTVAGDQC